MTLDQANKILEEIKVNFRKMGIPISERIDVLKVTSKSVRNFFGECITRGNSLGMSHTIRISPYVLMTDNIVEIKNILAHELVHTINGCQNHGANFLRYAKITKPEYNITVFASKSFTKEVEQYYPKPKPKPYRICCKHCETHGDYATKKTALKYCTEYHCAKCKGVFSLQELKDGEYVDIEIPVLQNV